MSQHIYRTQKRDGKYIVVMMGWDRLLQENFMAIERVGDASDDNDQIIYTTLSESDSSKVTLDFLKGVLKKLEISVPETMFTETLADRYFGLVNRIAVHSETGFTG